MTMSNDIRAWADLWKYPLFLFRNQTEWMHHVWNKVSGTGFGWEKMRKKSEMKQVYTKFCNEVG